MKKPIMLAWILIILSILLSMLVYNSMPLQMISHWNFYGQPNGFMLKFWSISLMPLISIFMLLLFLLIPKIDPLRKNIQKFRNYFDWFIFIIILFMFYMHVLVILANSGSAFNINSMMAFALALLFFYTGILIEKAKRNWSVGIRTPWTLSNEIVWNKTHRLGGKLFKVSALISLLGILIPEYAFFFIIVPIILASLYLILYSYFEYRKQTKKKGRK